MSRRIPPTHPLHGYHRRRPALAGRSEAEISRQWGRAEIVAGVPGGELAAGAHASVTIRFTVGSMGLDEDGGMKLAFRFVSDMGRLQSGDPEADDYVSATTSGPAEIQVQVEPKATVRPFQRTVFFHCRKATLSEGDTIDIVLGDTSGGSRGWRQQTYFETPFPVRVSVDPLGTHDYQELPRDLGWNIVPGPAARYVLNAPSFAAAGAAFPLRIKAEDAWGNPLRDLGDRPPQVVIFRGGGREPLRAEGRHEAGVWSYSVSLAEAGTYRFGVEADEPSVCNPVTVRQERALPPFAHRWCDLHGQSGETVGAGTLDDYFHFGRHYAFLDGSVHQGNDFQIGLDLWERIKSASNAAYEPGAFVTFQGYEWSGTEAMGGDHNVLFHEDDPPIYRSTGWLDGHPFEENAPLPELYRALRPHEAITIAHVGGRPAALTVSDADVEPVMEIHSAWGTFEWVYEEAFARGFKIGFVCNSDGHKCRPGASYPGAGIFGTLGGLTCLLTESFDRDGFWDALRSRRCYGTTGQRIIVEADLNGQPIGSDVRADEAEVRARVVGTAPITRIDLMRKGQVIQSHLPATTGDGQTLLLRLGGARVKGRARMVPWNGSVKVEGNRISDARMNGIFSPSYGIDGRTERDLSFRCVTTGNLVNLEMRFEHGLQGTLHFESEQTTFTLDLTDLSAEPEVLFEAPLDRRVEAVAVDALALPREVEARFSFAVDHDDEVPYFLRITQLDEGKAWTSPFYVRRGRT